MAHWQHMREIVERVFVTGTLCLDTPTHLGNGDSYSFTDMPLLLDPLEGRALLTGTSIAGALRHYLRAYERGYDVSETCRVSEMQRRTVMRAYECGYDVSETSTGLAAQLFGSAQGDKAGVQSWLIVDDALSDLPPGIELRDGVAIDPKTRTVLENKDGSHPQGQKFDMELLEAGTEFKVSFELLIPKGDGDSKKQALAIALRGLQSGEILLGKRKRRGFGRCHISSWQVQSYQMQQPQQLIAWLDDKGEINTGKDIVQLLNVNIETRKDARKVFTLEATFALDTSLLIRSDFGIADAPDKIHLHSRRGENSVPILSGTSLAGALRARALRILNTLSCEHPKTSDFINCMFGGELASENGNSTPKLVASKLITQETKINNPCEIVQSRLKIDRFTGGAYPGALFFEQPVFGGLEQETMVTIKLDLRQPEDAEIGLLLLLLKDLWVGDLPLGGESSVGRGRLRGKRATLRYKQPGTVQEQEWILQVNGDELGIVGNSDDLEHYVHMLNEKVQIWNGN